MKRAFAALLGLSLVAACALPPEGTTEADRANYDAAVASIGCTLQYESDYAPVELQTGLTREQVMAISNYRIALEQAVRTPEGGVRLTTGPCAPAA
jgi:uncharacterized protein YijF (DUF1287 family)